MKKLMLIFLLTTLWSATSAFAVTDGEREALVRLAKELDGLGILIDEAARHANPDDRFQVNYRALKRELMTVREGVLESVNDLPREPRQFTPIDGQYMR